MSENQLREAFVLMKQGDKAGASRIIQSVLREDRSNINAWWLYANLLDDEDKVVKALEKVLTLSPEHLGARKKLAAMRPEYAHLDTAKEAVKAKPEAANPVQKAKTANKSYRIRQNLAGLALLVGVIIFFCAGSVWVFISAKAQLTPTDSLGRIPADVATDYYTAMYKEDIAALYALTCPERHTRIDEMVLDFEGLNPDDVTVELSSTRFKLYNQTIDKAYIQISGSMTILYGGTQFTVDWVEDARAEGADGYGLFFERINDIWLVCNPYYIEDLNFHDS